MDYKSCSNIGRIRTKYFLNDKLHFLQKSSGVFITYHKHDNGEVRKTNKNTKTDLASRQRWTSGLNRHRGYDNVPHSFFFDNLSMVLLRADRMPRINRK